MRLLLDNVMVGSLGERYKSVENMDESYLQPNVDTDILLKPKTKVGSSVPLLSLPSPTPVSTAAKKISGTRSGVIRQGKGRRGYVKGIVTYMIMDNLEVK
ncbi:hypothetical protein TIFTF001_026431 [Ficus carica]|uniref:Uncharacterized protein n=1 Tax=Ficus carica TaxID=3494 RepID=A0AA88DLS0_FICCA|nr:hypothetical protein TIFTF001_026431 [Ficus carica]